MRSRHFLFIACLLISFLAGHVTATQIAHADSQRTQMVSDEKAGVLRFMIDGKTAAWLDAGGLHVIHGIEYGDTITDTGPKYLADRAGGSDAP